MRSTSVFGSLSQRQTDPEDLVLGPSNNGLQRTGCDRRRTQALGSASGLEDVEICSIVTF